MLIVKPLVLEIYLILRSIEGKSIFKGEEGAAPPLRRAGAGAGLQLAQEVGEEAVLINLNSVASLPSLRKRQGLQSSLPHAVSPRRSAHPASSRPRNSLPTSADYQTAVPACAAVGHLPRAGHLDLPFSRQISTKVYALEALILPQNQMYH